MSTTTCNKFKGEIENYLRNGQNNIESANQAKKMYKDIENYVKDKDISDVVIYDANLRTLKPKSVWEEDAYLVQIAMDNNITWYYLAGNNNKKEFNEEWKKQTGWNNLPQGRYKKIPVPEEDWPLPNLFSVPKLGQCYIGFGDYDDIGIKRKGDEPIHSRGGGIWIDDE